MTSQGFRVRIADAADLAGVVALERTTEEAPHWAESEYAAILSANSEADSIGRCLLIADSEGMLVGFAVGKTISSGATGMAELESVVVDRSVRRIGVGRALCSAVIAWSKAQRVTALELEVRAGSAGAIALYAGLGFGVSGRRRGYYRDPVEDGVLMRLDLPKGDLSTLPLLPAL